MPRPPSSGRPGSKARLRRVVGSASRKSTSLNRNLCLPPLGQTLLEEDPDSLPSGFDPATIQAAKELFESAAAASSSDSVTLAAPLGIRRLESVESKLKPLLSSVREDGAVGEEENPGEQPAVAAASSSNHIIGSDSNVISETKDLSKEAILCRAQSSLRASRKWDFSQELLLKNEPKPPSAPRKRDPSPLLDSYSIRPSTSSTKGLERLLEKADIDASGPGRPMSQSQEILYGASGNDSGLSAVKDSYMPSTSSKFPTERRPGGGGVVLESLHPSEVRAMSGMLSSLVRSASKSRAGYSLAPSSYKDVGRVTTPEGRLVVSIFYMYIISTL